MRTEPGRGERGQVLVLVAGGMVAFIMLVALAVDGGYAFWVKRSLQSSSDAAALAGAQALPDGTTATTVAHEYSGSKSPQGRNYSAPLNTQTTVTTDCRGSGPCPDTVVVVETATVPTFFVRLFGVETYDVRARAVASKISQGGGPGAVYAHEPCGNKGLKMNGNNIVVDGTMHSNGNFSVNGNDFQSGTATIHRPQSGCTTTYPSPAEVDFGGADQPTEESPARDWPVFFTTSQFPCNFGPNDGNDYKVGKSYADNATMAAGVYCVPNGKFILDRKHIEGTITVVANEIELNGEHAHLEHHTLGVLLFQTSTKEMKINATPYTFEGIIFHPGGHIVVNGNDASSIDGYLVGRSVEVNGNGFTMKGTGGGGGAASTLALVE